MQIGNDRIGESPVVIGVQGRAVRCSIGAPQTLNSIGRTAEVLRATNVHHVTNGDIISYYQSGFDQLRTCSRSISSPNFVVGSGRSSLDREEDVIFC